MIPVKVFISYRRDTDGARATLVEKSISGAFAQGGSLSRTRVADIQVYFDARNRLGVAWPARIKDEIASADIVIAIIGPDWLSARDEKRRRRIELADDWVRRELEIALSTDSLLIPILFDGAKMPKATELPESISDLAARQDLPVRTSSFDFDIQRLLGAILDYAQSSEGPNSGRSTGGTTDVLWPYPDPPLPVRAAPLSDEDVDMALKHMLPNWERRESPLPEDPAKRRVELHRKLSFSSFIEALQFMNEVARFCDDANHHPRWMNLYRTVWIDLSTWDIGHRVSQQDVSLAAYIDKTYRTFEVR